MRDQLVRSREEDSKKARTERTDLLDCSACASEVEVGHVYATEVCFSARPSFIAIVGFGAAPHTAFSLLCSTRCAPFHSPPSSSTRRFIPPNPSSPSALRLAKSVLSACPRSMMGSSGGQEHQGYEKPKSGNLKRKCSGSPRQLETLWSTRRHPESCRALSFDADGRALISAGTEGIVKVADVESGRVAVKIALPHDR